MSFHVINRKYLKIWFTEHLKPPGQTTSMNSVGRSTLRLRVQHSSIPTLELPKNEEFVDENGIRTTIEYTLNDEGKKVKVLAAVYKPKFPR